MQIKKYKDYETLSRNAASEITGYVKRNPEAVLCLAAGDTPRLTYAYVAEQAAADKIDFSRCTFIGLDEWVGIPPDNEGSCRYFLEQNLFKPLGISTAQIHLFDALAKNLLGECKKMDKAIAHKRGIDLMVVGVGMNGHIGFNEPGVSFGNYSHVVDLDSTTQSVGQKYFREPTTLTKGITLGLQHLVDCKKVILLANGIRKAEVIKRALQEQVRNNMPASIVRSHPAALVMIDDEAASLLK